jgi:hypothetical protein
MFSLVGKQQQNLCTRPTMEHLWYTRATSSCQRRACQNYSSLLRLALPWRSTPTEMTWILYCCPLPANVIANSSQEKPAKLLLLLANEARLPPSKPAKLLPLPPLKSAALLPPPLPKAACPLPQNALPQPVHRVPDP